MYAGKDLSIGGFRGNLPSHKCDRQEQELDEYLPVTVRRYAAVYDDSHADAARFRRDECGSVSGWRGDLCSSHRRSQQYGS